MCEEFGGFGRSGENEECDGSNDDSQDALTACQGVRTAHGVESEGGEVMQHLHDEDPCPAPLPADSIHIDNRSSQKTRERSS
jgi:hypothetical protein